MHFKQILVQFFQLLLLLILLLSPSQLPAQTPPGSDIFLIPLNTDGKSLTFGEPRNITARPGYDNQPAFTPDGGGVLYVSIREDGQADIYRYDITSGKTMQVTATAESEYSPTIMPGGAYFSCVRVEGDGTQRLWRFDLSGQNPKVLLEEVTGVGYHGWGDETTVGMFIVGEPHWFCLADIASGRADSLAAHVGRSIHLIPGRRALSFPQQSGENQWQIMQLNLDTREVTPLAQALPGSQDYVWTPEGAILMAQENRLYRWTEVGKQWELLQEFAQENMAALFRLALSPDRHYLSVVAGE